MKSILSIRTIKAYFFLLLIVSSYCVDVKNTITLQKRMQESLERKKRKPDPPTGRRNAIVPGSAEYEALVDFQSEVGVPNWAFRLYVKLTAADKLINSISSEVTKTDLLPCGTKTCMKDFVEAMLTQKIGFEITTNADGKVRPKLLLTSWSKTKADTKYKPIVDAYEKLDKSKKGEVQTAIMGGIVKHLMKALLKYVFFKLIEGTLSLAIPGAGIMIAIYKLYKMVSVKIEKATKKNQFTATICVTAAEVANVGSASICIEIDFVSATFAKMKTAYDKLKGWFSKKKTELVGWFKKKFASKKLKTDKAGDPVEVDAEGDDVVAVIEANQEIKEDNKVSDLFEFTNIYDELVDISDVFS